MAIPRMYAASNSIETASPDGRIVLVLSIERGRLTYEVARNGSAMLEKAAMGIRTDGQTAIEAAHFSSVRRYRIDDSYPWYGVHSVAEEHGVGTETELVGADGAVLFTVEARAYDNGVALRMTLPGKAGRVPIETVAFRPPAESGVWSFDPTERQYEGVYEKSDPAGLPAGRFMAPPVVIELPGDSAYLAITEGRLENYPGMVLQSDGKGAFFVRPGNDVPADKALVYFDGEAYARRIAVPSAMSGPIVTPWRIVMIGSTLNDLVNNDIVSDVSDVPDAKLFPRGLHTSWIKPGRAVWNYYLDGGSPTLEGAREASRMAAELGFEYQVIEGQWRRWSEADLKSLVDYSRQRGVGIWLWKNRKDLGTREQRDAFFELCNRVGVMGVKIDFFDSEAREVIDLYQSILKEAAEHRLLVNFHGANKPTGEQRTWPNELTREAVEGMEYCCIKDLPDAPRARHAVTLPFTRFLAGPGDYTPVLFDKGRNGTTWANQIASAVILTSPLLTYAANPEKLLSNPALNLIKQIPATWDETVVLPSSRIGEVAVFARRSGQTWFLACMNGDASRSFDIPLSFLGSGRWMVQAVSDVKGNAEAVSIGEAKYQRGDTIHLELKPGGGQVAEFTRE
ncbi:MAG TPA: glycoside hydrolase family 97 catalytic domain-containing protein [Terracidiphilus sp.]|nr:glycoside hydrolase family 97 catalytic domain-containing protein [Terracidiphilus sp.]